jgi:hypothetical protein
LHIITKELNETQNKELLFKLYNELNLVLNELMVLDNNVDKNIVLLELTNEKKEQLFLQLKEAILSKRPKKYKPIIEDIEKYKLSKEDKEFFEKVKILIDKYKFKEATKLFDD